LWFIAKPVVINCERAAASIEQKLSVQARKTYYGPLYTSLYCKQCIYTFTISIYFCVWQFTYIWAVFLNTLYFLHPKFNGDDTRFIVVVCYGHKCEAMPSRSTWKSWT
jgi:hypothetical protein